MRKKDRRSINNKYLKKQMILLIIISIYLLSLSFISARYVVKKVDTYLSSSKEFYFYSDKLSEKEKDYPINWSGNEECIIPINLYTKLNSLKTTSHDIKYKVEYELLSSNAICKLSKEEGVVSAINNTDAFTISVTPNGKIQQDETIEVKVNVSTVDDFEKILTANFVIAINNDDVMYKIDDKNGRAYFNLIINNTSDEAQKITLNFNPNDAIIDTTSNIFNTLNSYELSNGTRYINKITFTLEPRTNINVKFFKQDKSQNYTNSNNILNCKFEKI